MAITKSALRHATAKEFMMLVYLERALEFLLVEISAYTALVALFFVFGVVGALSA